MLLLCLIWLFCLNRDSYVCLVVSEACEPQKFQEEIKHGTATSNARFWVWVHVLVNLVAMTFLFTMNLCLPWVLNFNLSQARLLKETACNYVFSVLVHGIPSISAWISIHQNSQKLFCAKTSIGH